MGSLCLVERPGITKLGLFSKIRFLPRPISAIETMQVFRLDVAPDIIYISR